MKITSRFALTAAALFLASHADAAQVRFVNNSVKEGSKPVAAGTAVNPGSTISTGSQSKTQVDLTSSGSMMRAGSKTEAVLKNDTSLSLSRGIMLASSGGGALGREPVNLETPEIKATAKGTMLVAYQPKAYIKITCIEGKVSVRMKALLGEVTELRAGQMLIINPAEKRLPTEVEVDLGELTQSCVLLGAGFPSLDAGKIEGAAGRQAKQITDGGINRTPLVMNGAGPAVTLTNEAAIERLRPQPVVPKVLVKIANSPQPVPRPAATAEYIIDGSTQFTFPSTAAPIDNISLLAPPGSPTLQTPGFPLVQGVFVNQDEGQGAYVFSFPNALPDSPELLFRGTTSLPFISAIYNVNGVAQIGNGIGIPATVRTGSTFDLRASDSIFLAGAQILKQPDASPGVQFSADRKIGIDDSLINVPREVYLDGNFIDISNSTITSQNREVGVTSHATSPAAGGISVRNSSQLSSLAASFGQVNLQTDGGFIFVNNSQLSGSEINLDTGTNDSLIEIRNSVLNADSIRARAFNSGDRDALVVSDSVMNANQLIDLYAEGASKLRFQGKVDLNAPRTTLAGRTVQVDNGGVVRASGSLDVYRDVDNYNKPGFGTLSSGFSSSHNSFSSRPQRP